MNYMTMPNHQFIKAGFCLVCLFFNEINGQETEEPTNPQTEKSVITTDQYFDQGWDADMRNLYYFTPQGSHLIPYQWFLALESATSKTMFSDRTNLTKYGWYWTFDGDDSPANPDGLPIGFTKGTMEVKGTGKWLGWTCAACHTGELAVNKKRYRIDGGASQVNVGTFLTDLSATVRANLVDAEKFKRFVGRVLGTNPDPSQVKTLTQQYKLYSSSLSGRVALRTPTHPAGPGRVDALNQIINAMSVTQLGEPDNYQPPNAPVSYPFLWYTPQLAWVQWSPISSNPIGRNTGQVLGVFGDADFTLPPQPQTETAHLESNKAKTASVKDQKIYEFLARHSVPDELKTSTTAESESNLPFEQRAQQGFLSSTANIKNLFDLEQWLQKLKEPQWIEEDFGTIDLDLSKKGAELFKQDCRVCHNMPPFDFTDKADNIAQKQFIKIGRTPYNVVGTDSTYTETLIGRLSKTGDLGPVLFEGEEVVPSAQFFLGGVLAVVEKGLNDLGLTPQEKLLYSGFRFYPPEKPGDKPKPYRPTSITDLKAGPLLGIWATGPFLHNGSIPNIYELISPPESRSSVFWVGSHELDTKKLGYKSEEAPGLFRYDTSIKGNGNSGHVYPEKPYTEEQKMALIEFLKKPTLSSNPSK